MVGDYQREPVPGHAFKSDAKISAAGPDRAVVVIPVGLNGHRLVIAAALGVTGPLYRFPAAHWAAEQPLKCPGRV